MTSSEKKIFLILGSNLGDRAGSLKKARDLAGSEIGPVGQESSVYESHPWGSAEGGPFLNQVITTASELEPLHLLEKLHEIEKRLGRQRPLPSSPGYHPRSFAARTIDIDILLFGTAIIDIPALRIPHPFIALRRFVLVPMAEIAPALVHPVLKQSIDTLLADCPDKGVVKPYPPGLP